MQVPLQVSFRGVDQCDALYRAIRARAEKLERYCDHIMSCRVALEQSASHHRQGRQYAVRIDLKVPGGEVAVTHEENESLDIALRDAFAAARRRLENYARDQRPRERQA